MEEPPAEQPMDLAKIQKEAEIVFEDQIGYRRKSPRVLIEHTFAEEINMAAREEGQGGAAEGSPAEPVQPRIAVRYRAPVHNPPMHDIFGDSVLVIFQNLLAKGQAPDISHWLAYVIASEISEVAYDRNLIGIVYNPDVYITEGTDDIKKMFSAEHIWPAVDKILQKSGDMMEDKWTGMYVAAHQLRGQRHKQEDRFVAYPNQMYMDRGNNPLTLLGVFDGHGGHECSHYAAGHFWEAWVKELPEEGKERDTPLDEMLVSSLARLDSRLSKRCTKEMWKGGSTAVCAAIDMTTKEAAFAWLGDSPGYIMNNLECVKITREHSPNDPGEAARVEQAGGQLFLIGGELRVNGVLNLTRALGDVQGRPMISNEPEARKVSIGDADYLVVLACDGISEVFKEYHLYDLVEKFVQENKIEDYSLLSRYIAEQAIERGSTDNVTVVIGFLRPPQHLWRLFGNSGEANVEEEEADEES